LVFRGKNDGWLQTARHERLNDDEGMRGFDLLFSCLFFFVFEYIQDCVVGVCVCVFWTVGWMVGLYGDIIVYFSSSLFLLYRTTGLFSRGFSGLIRVGLLPFLWVSKCIMKR